MLQFDTVDHQVLLCCLEVSFGTALKWFKSYLTNRSQHVLINGNYSESFSLPHGVPQSSCLGPLLFTIYASKLFEIVKCHLPDVHAYADDTQLYFSFKPDGATNELDVIFALQNCVKDIRTSMTVDKLKLNDGKTEFLISGTAAQLKKANISSVVTSSVPGPHS